MRKGAEEVNQSRENNPRAELVVFFFAPSCRDVRAVMPAQSPHHQRDPWPGGPIPLGCFGAAQLFLPTRWHRSRGLEDLSSGWFL